MPDSIEDQTSALAESFAALPQFAQQFVQQLIALDPPPEEIWLIGSRANGRATEDSDTDLLVFASSEFKAILTSSLAAPPNIDCLVVGGNGEYADAWRDKTGSLDKLRWNREGAAVARYIGVKWIPDPPEERDERQDSSIELGNFQHRDERAIRLFPGA